jgi:hypothetical protein
MRFRTRSILPGDVAECVGLLLQRPGLAERYPTIADRRFLADRLYALVQHPAVTTGLAETPDFPPGERMLTFGLSAFVRPAWLHAFLAEPRPLPYVLHDCLGPAVGTILLDDDEVAQANSSQGLHAVTLCYGWDVDRVPPAHVFSFRQAGLQCFLECHEGYRLASMLSECLQGRECDIFLSSGAWRPRSDYAAYYARRGESPDVPRLLIGLTKREAESIVLTAAVTANLFVWRQPHYCFTPGQQAQLRLAMTHASDREMAETLGVTEHSIGRRWIRIFRRVEALQPADAPIFPPDCEPNTKRARLIQRLAREMHELRPHVFRRSLPRRRGRQV